jgi:hypothetical protein
MKWAYTWAQGAEESSLSSKTIQTPSYLVKRQFFSMSLICNEKCSKPKIFFAFLSKLLCFSFIL